MNLHSFTDIVKMDYLLRKEQSGLGAGGANPKIISELQDMGLSYFTFRFLKWYVLAKKLEQIYSDAESNC